MNHFFVTALAATNPDGFWGAIKGVAISWVNSFVDVLLVPVGIAICAVFFIINLVKCITEYQAGHGDQITGKIMYMVLIIIIAALLLAKNLWWSYVFGG